MKNPDTIYAVLPFIVIIALGTGFWFVFRERAAARREALERRMSGSEPGEPSLRGRLGRRPWWANPWLWLGVSVASILLGIFVWPGLFGGVIVLPMVWFTRPRRGPRMDPQTNGHREHGDPGPVRG